MNRPPLALFLDDSIVGPSTGDEGPDPVGATLARLSDVLATIIDRRGLETVAEQTGLDRTLLASLGEGGPEASSNSERALTLETTAAILAVESAHSPAEVRARIRDNLIVQMSRGPTDVGSLAATYGFGHASAVRGKIEGDRPLSLREYARLRVALDR